MADPRFFAVAGPFTLGALAEIAEASLSDAADPDRVIRDVAPLDNATGDDVSFLDNRRYAASFAASRAGACVVRAVHAPDAPAGMALLLSETPYLGYARIAQAFYPPPTVVAGMAPSAVVDPSASLGPGCRLEANVVIGADARLGARCLVGANTVIGPGVEIGDDVRLGSNVTLGYCMIGSRVRLFSGVRIGEDGFGFAVGPQGPIGIPQLGRVVIEDEVEIGANSTIDRGAGPDTVIGRGSRIDNLVQIGHNVTLGHGCIVVAQAGISGSTTLDDHAVIAAQVGVAGHLRIGKGAQIGAKSGVMRDVGAGEAVVGSPAMPVKSFFRGIAILKRLADRNSG